MGRAGVAEPSTEGVQRCESVFLHGRRLTKTANYETFDQTFSFMNTMETMDKYLETAFNRDRLQKELSSPRCGFFFMYSDGELSGYLKLNEAPEQSDLNDPDSI